VLINKVVKLEVGDTHLGVGSDQMVDSWRLASGFQLEYRNTTCKIGRLLLAGDVVVERNITLGQEAVANLLR
jgi:hypothetical protein